MTTDVRANPIVKAEFSKELADAIMDALATAPDSQVSEDIRQAARVMIARSPSLREMYDFIDNISLLRRSKTMWDPSNVLSPGARISSFVEKLCMVRTFYNEPKDGT